MLLKQDLARLSPAEREVVDLILKELEERNDPSAVPSEEPSLIELLGQAEYKTPPVDMETFVKDPYYLGETCSNIYPKLLADLKEMFEGGYSEAILCLHPDTPIPLLDGTTATIAKLAERWQSDPEPFWVYSCRPDGSVLPALAEQPRCTGEDDYYRVRLEDGSHFVGNARHRMVLRDGTKRTIEELKAGDSLMPFQTRLSKRSQGRRIEGYELVLDNKIEREVYTHVCVESLNGPIDSKIETIHHVNFRKTDNRPSNLTRMPWKDHRLLHARAKRAYFAENPEVRANLVSRQRQAASDPSSPLRKGHLEYMRSEKGRRHARASLEKWNITPEEKRAVLAERAKTGRERRWQGEGADEQKAAAAERMRARNLAGNAKFAGRRTWIARSEEAKKAHTARLVARNKEGRVRRPDVTLESILSARAGGATTIKAVSVALGCSTTRVRSVLREAGIERGTLFRARNHCVVSVEHIGRGPVYCMTVPQTENFAICTLNDEGAYTRNGVYSSNTGGIGSGKTFTASIGICRVLYEISCMRDPHAGFGLAKDTNISFLALSVNESLAQKVVFENLVVKLKASAYFNEQFPFATSKTELRFPHNVWVAPRATTATSALGLNVIGALIDEAAFLGTSKTAAGEIDKADTIYHAILRRMKSRFERQGKLPGMLFLVSSKTSDDDFTARRIQQSLNDPSVYVTDYTVWQTKPDAYYNQKRFWVLCGNSELGSRILEDNEDPEKLRPTLPEGVVLLDVPIDFRKDFERDLESAIRDIGGISSSSLRPYIQRREKIKEAIDPGLSHPFSTAVYDMSKGGTFMWSRMVGERRERIMGYGDRPILRPLLNPAANRHIHVDLGLKHDAAALCMAHVSGHKDVIRRSEDGREYVEKAPVYTVDCMLRIVPPTGGEIVFGDIRHLIYDLIAHGYTVTCVSYDSWQSTDGLQILGQRGINAEMISVDTSPEPYDTLKTALYENRVRLYHDEHLFKELVALEEHTKGVNRKIDHPKKGSKDQSDSLAGVVFTLSQQRLVAPLPIMKGLMQDNDPWMHEQQQSYLAGNRGANENTGLLPAFLTGDGGDPDWGDGWNF